MLQNCNFVLKEQRVKHNLWKSLQIIWLTMKVHWKNYHFRVYVTLDRNQGLNPMSVRTFLGW